MISVLMLAVIAAAAAISTQTSAYFTLIAASAAAAYVYDFLGRPLLAALGAALAFGVSFIIKRDVLTAAHAAAVITVVGLLFVLCRKKSFGLFKSSIILGSAFALVSLAAAAIRLQSVYGNVIEGAKTAASYVYQNALERMKEYAGAENGALSLSDNQIEEYMSFLATLLPGIAAAVVQLSGAFAYFIMKAIYRLSGAGKNKPKGEYDIPASPVVYFAFSVLLTLVFSLIKQLEFARLAALNLCIALAIPTLVSGIVRLVRKMKDPPTVTAPDGTAVRRPPVLLLSFIVLSAIFNIAMPVLILLIYSVTGTLKDLLSERKKQEK